MRQRATRFVRRAVAPSWATWLAATALALAVTWATWRTWQTPIDDGTWAIEHHYLWPAYRWSHGDLVEGPVAGGLAWNYLAGVAICWVPAGVAVESARTAGRRAVVRLDPLAASRDRYEQAANALAMRSRPFWATVACAALGSLVPPWYLSLYTFPGTVLAPVAASVLPIDRYSDLQHAFRPALAFPVWYALVAGAASVARRLDWSPLEARSRDVDPVGDDARRGRR